MIYQRTQIDASNDPQYCLKQNSQQKQKQKFIVAAFSDNISSCDLMLWTPSGISINQVERNEHFMDTFKLKVDNFIHDNFVPELKNRKLE